MKRLPAWIFAVVLTALFAAAWAGKSNGTPSADDRLDRTVRPIPEPKNPHITELDARKVTRPPFFEVKAPKGAPNEVIVLIDDMGFGQPSTFGGAINI